MNVFDSAKHGNIDELREFVRRGGDVSPHLKTELGRTPLHLAIEQNRLPAVELLLALGANVNAGDYRKKTPLQSAAGLGLLSLAELLIKNGADPNAMDVFGENALHYVANGGGTSPETEQVSIVRALVKAGVPVDSAGNAARTALYYAAARGKLLVSEELLRLGADPSRSANGKLGAPIDAASRAGNHEVEALLKRRREING